MSRRAISAVVAPLVLVLVSAWPSGASPAAAPGRPGRAGGNAQAVTSERLQALSSARDAGILGQSRVSTSSGSATGWVGERVVNANVDDWEPAVATDPSAPYVYLLTTRYGQPKPCPSHCPSPFIALTISSDRGATWGAQVPLCVCRGSGAQYDPTIQVVPDTGVLYAVFLNADRAGGFSAVFSSSSDHGQTWTAPVHVYQNSWTDKPEVTMSPSGEDVYVSWNGQTGGDLWVGISHDFGATWTQTRVVNSKRYFYAYDAVVVPDGTVVFSESSLTYTGPGASVEGDVWHHAIISRDQGATWENVIVDMVPVGEACVATACPSDFYIGQTSVSANANGHLVFAYEGAATEFGPQRVFVRTSDDEGRTWGPRTALSVDGEDATGPRLAAIGTGDVRIWYMQTSGGDNPDSWNVWYRSSKNGGITWSAPVKISDAPAGAAGYINANGFDEIYGDYGEIGITSAGKTIGVWGEAYSYAGPGGCWFNIQS